MEGNVINHGTLQGGDPPGTLNIIGNLTLRTNGTLSELLGGIGAGQFSQLDIGGSAALGGELSVKLVDNFTLTGGDSFDIMNYASVSDGFSSFIFDGIACSSAGPDRWTCPNGHGLVFGEVIDPTSLFLNVTTSTTPLPTTLPLLASGLGVLGVLGWRRKRKGAALAAA